MSKAEAAWPPPPSFFRKRKHDPPPQVKGNFSMYGVSRSTEEPVNPAPEQQVYDSSLPRCQELRRLNKASLNMYMKLLQTMVLAPSEMDSQLVELRTLLLNLQHLANTFRPDQSRSQLGDIMKQQVHMKRQLIAALRMARQQGNDAYVATHTDCDADNDGKGTLQTGHLPSDEGCAIGCGPGAQASSSATQLVRRPDLSLVYARLDQVACE